MKQIDINSMGQYPANVLSNLYIKPFFMDGEYFGSIEGFLQGLRVKNVIDQRAVFRLSGITAKLSGKKHPINKEQMLYYKGVKFNRHSEFYHELIERAFSKCFVQNDVFKEALAACDGCELIHSIGKDDPFDTILTNAEFIGALEQLRKQYKLTIQSYIENQK